MWYKVDKILNSSQKYKMALKYEKIYSTLLKIKWNDVEDSDQTLNVVWLMQYMTFWELPNLVA